MDLVMATNYFGPFLLTKFLMPSLESAASESGEKSKVINVSSIGHLAAPKLDLKALDLNLKDSKAFAEEAYHKSKLCQLIFSTELARRMTEEDKLVESIAIHPGN